MKAGDYQKARALLQDAIDMSLDEREEAEYRFFAAYTEQMMGRPGEALRLMDGIAPDPMAEYYGDYALLHGRLLLESLSFGRALAVLDEYLSTHGEGETSQVALILAAAAHSGAGEPAKARVRLEKAQTLDPRSEAGKRASELLTRL
jgi:tetratricopeptide (TPR) repeat protein